MAIYINTNQNVKINIEISSIGDRLIAYLIDALVIFGITIGVLFIGTLTHFDVGIFLFFSIIFFYHLISEITMNGQSIGKRYRGIRVIKKDGHSATISGYLLRFLLRPIDSFYGIGLAVIFFTKNNQRIGDLAAGTIVVNLKSKNELKNQIRKELSVQKDTIVMYAAVDRLTDQEIQLIRKILNNRRDTKNHDNIYKLASKIGLKIEVDFDQSESYQFLERVVQDYYSIYSS